MRHNCSCKVIGSTGFVLHFMYPHAIIGQNWSNVGNSGRFQILRILIEAFHNELGIY